MQRFLFWTSLFALAILMARIVFDARESDAIVVNTPVQGDELLASTISFTKVLQRGSRGDAVSELQAFLKQFPDIYPSGFITGFFGKGTEDAVKIFQKKYGIFSTGIVGPRTLAKIHSLIVDRQVSVPQSIVVPTSIPAPVVAAPTPPDVTPPIVRLVATGNITRVTAMVNWLTDEFADSEVEYGFSTDYEFRTIVDPQLVTDHIVKLTDLRSGSLYHYRVRSADKSGNVRFSEDQTFRPFVTEPSEHVPGICLIRDPQKNVRTIGFFDPDIGVGYVKQQKQTAFLIEDLRLSCTASDFDGLFDAYCTAHPGATAIKSWMQYLTSITVAQSVDVCPTCAVLKCKN